MPQTCKPIRPTLSAFSNCLFGFLGRKQLFKMKKYLLALLVCVMAFAGCSKDDDEISTYSEKQKKAFALFTGTWADIQFSNLSGGELSHLLPDPDIIVFGTNYEKEIEVTKDDYMNGKEHLFFAQGECTYRSFDIVDKTYTDIECYYYLSYDAEDFYLYEKSTNRLYNSYYIDIESEAKIYLHDRDLSLPYIFIKQK